MDVAIKSPTTLYRLGEKSDFINLFCELLSAEARGGISGIEIITHDLYRGYVDNDKVEALLDQLPALEIVSKELTSVKLRAACLILINGINEASQDGIVSRRYDRPVEARSIRIVELSVALSSVYASLSKEEILAANPPIWVSGINLSGEDKKFNF